MFEISGKVAFITGGASGIGFALSKELLQNGLKGVAICDINESRGLKALQSLKSVFGEDKAIFITLDVSDRKKFHEAFATTVKKFKNLDIVVNSAGIVKDDKWEESVAVNLGGTITGTYLALEKYLPQYKTGNEAVVVNLSSSLALKVAYHCPVYAATKYGIIGLSRSFGADIHYNRTNVKVLTICPGYTDTPLVNSENRSLLEPLYENLLSVFMKAKTKQQVESVSKGISEIIHKGRSGSVWVCEHSQDPYEIEILVKQRAP
ncbi:hypothetical protein FQA39_LY03946 [Lamprigera yunnana]|nr:hypothetical protein FQA39_LY03946 [Lamprigera yunnana]